MTTATYSDARDTTRGLSKRERYGILQASLWNERASFDPHWKELAQFIKPRRTRYLVSDRNKGDRRNYKIIDSTATLAHRTLQSGMHAGITSPARPWMRLTVDDPDLAKFAPVKQWLHTVTQRMLDVFQGSNIYNTFPTMYGDLGLFGTAAMGIMEDEQDVIRAYSYPLGSFAMGMSSRGKCSTFVREYEMTVFQVVEEFAWDKRTNEIDWSIVSDYVKTAWDRGNYQQAVVVVWIAMPNTDADPSKISARYLPTSSCWFEKNSTDGKFLRESGFNEFPVVAPRWDVTGEDTYGTDCPGMTALGDVKGLQTSERIGAQGLQKMVNPALQAPVELRSQSISMLPGAISYTADGPGRQGIRALHEVNLGLDKLEMKNAQVRERISMCFYEPLFLMLAQSDRRDFTAREVEERHEEKLLALGPMLERVEDEGLDPAIDRIYGIMDRRGLIPPAPQELHGVNLKPQYTSIMAEAQKLVGATGLDRLSTTIVSLAPTFPEVRHKLDSLAVVDEYADLFSVNPKIIVDNDAAQKSIAAEQQMQQQQHSADLAAKFGGAAKDLAATPTGGQTALSSLISQMGVQQ